MEQNQAKELLTRTQNLHMAQFKLDLPLAEIAQLLAQVIEFKRKKLLESCLVDHPVEDLFTLMEAVNALDDERLAAFDKARETPNEAPANTRKRSNRSPVNKP